MRPAGAPEALGRIRAMLGALLALTLAAAVLSCAHGKGGRAAARTPALSRVEVQGGADFARVTLYFLGDLLHDDHLEPLGDGRRLVLEIHPASLPATLPAPFTSLGRGAGFTRSLTGAPIDTLSIEPGSRPDAIRVTLSGPGLARFRAETFDDPYRLVVDVFSDADPQATGGEDALSTLVGAMSETPPPHEDGGPLRVVVDAGHGGFEPGAMGPHGLKEKDVNLAIARAVGRRLATVPGVDAVLTRDSDVFLPLKDRTDFANELDADLFVSIHANAAPTRTLHGIETYYLNTATDEAAARLARRENSVAGGLAEELGDDHLMGLLRDLSVGGTVEHSRDLALKVQREMVLTATARYGADTVRDLGVKTALFYVLVGTRMPAILVETAFVSNPVEEVRLGDPVYQEEVAAAVVRGILAYAREAGQLASP